MEFRPTENEMQNFSEYIKKIETQGAHEVGICKIIPPKTWSPRKSGYDNIDIVIPFPVRQKISGRVGIYSVDNTEQQPMHLTDFKAMAENATYLTPKHLDYTDLERKYWKNLKYISPIYGVDVPSTLFGEELETFCLPRLKTILDLVTHEYRIGIRGVTSSYLYFGMWKTTFPWHTEDLDLYGINFLHFGAPKTWYGIAPKHGKRFERFALNLYGREITGKVCPAYLRHKTAMISPTILKGNSIEFVKVVQEPGEFIVTFPYAYHAGFNHGYNCAEAINFATERWIEYGKRANLCYCRRDSVRFCMDVFIKKYQPDRYKLWRTGKDVGCHPEEPSKNYPAPLPKKKIDLGAEVLERKWENFDLQVPTTDKSR